MQLPYQKINNKTRHAVTLRYGKREVFVFKDTGSVADSAVALWDHISTDAVNARGRFTVALSGGKTPVTLYTKLAEKKSLPWDRTFVFMVDERFVPYESEENNYHMISSTLIRHVQIPARNIHPVMTLEETAEDSASRYEKDIVSFFKQMKSTLLPRFDMVLLGIGRDGHTASLFPGSEALYETGHAAVSVPSPDGSTTERITLTLPVINNSEHIIFIVTGKDKAEIMKRVLENEDNSLPASMVRAPESGRLIFLLDQHAASLLSGGR